MKWRATQTRHEGVFDIDAYVTIDFEPCIWLARRSDGHWWALSVGIMDQRLQAKTLSQAKREAEQIATIHCYLEG